MIKNKTKPCIVVYWWLIHCTPEKYTGNSTFLCMWIATIIEMTKYTNTEVQYNVVCSILYAKHSDMCPVDNSMRILIMLS